MATATVRDLIKALQKFPMDTPVFAYSNLDECDIPITKVALYHPRYEKEEETGKIYVRGHYCQGDSSVERHWEENGAPCDVIYLM